MKLSYEIKYIGIDGKILQPEPLFLSHGIAELATYLLHLCVCVSIYISRYLDHPLSLCIENKKSERRTGKMNERNKLM